MSWFVTVKAVSPRRVSVWVSVRCRVNVVADALEQVEALGGSVVHPGEAWAICKDSERRPFGLARQGVGG